LRADLCLASSPAGSGGALNSVSARSFRAASLAIGLSLALALAWSTASAGAAVRPLNTGVSNVYSNDEAAFTHVRETGSTLALSPLRWRVVAPAKPPVIWNPEDPSDPNYNWTFIDKWVKGAVAAGLTPVLQIRSAPAWAERCTPTPDYESVCDPDPAALAAFTKAAVRRFSGSFGGLPRVRYWEGLNEPNLSLYFEPQFAGGKPIAPDLYRTLLNTFYATVKGIDSSNLVLAPGLGPIESIPFAIGPMRFTRLLLCMKGKRHPKPTAGDCGGGVHFDIFDIHPYTTGGPTHEGGPNDVEMGDLAKMQELIAAADKAHRIVGAFKRTPLWITEFSYDTNPPDPGGLSMKTSSQWIAESLYLAWSNRVSTFMWYSLDDEAGPIIPHDSGQSGLYYWAPTVAAEQPKPAMFAYRFPFVAFRRSTGLKYWGRTPNSKGGRIVLQARRGGKWRKLGVARADSAGIFQGFVRTGYGAGRKGAVRARFRKESSPGFPMLRVGDVFQPPFG
jgi:hypothetical protein